MGEVYRASDARLKRDVAIKVLPPAFVGDAERLERFEREAQILAQLHHPNIAAIYGLEEADGGRALVMELVEGPTLAERLERGALPVDEAAAVALQIARALEAAHEKGIVHRDLKPQNVKVDAEGSVRVLDFGLAKAMESEASASGDASPVARSPTLMNSPTMTGVATQLGVILGTAAYMAPEQAKGTVVDKRADIWSFGVVLHEMLTGGSLFAAPTVPETLARVLMREPDLAALPAATPPALRRLLARCLERDPKGRLRDIGEARVALERLGTGDGAGADAPAAAPASGGKRALPWIGGAIAGAAAALLLYGALAAKSKATPEPTSILALRLPPEISIPADSRGTYGQTGVLAISPDGRQVAFVAGSVGEAPIYLRSLGDPAVRKLEGSEGASSPFFAPDGRWVGYFGPGKLHKIAVDGGRPIDLADASLDRGAVWCPDGSIVYAPHATSGLFRLPAAGGNPVALTEPDVANGERTHRWPALLPNGREVAFTIGRADSPGDYEDSRIEAVEIATGKRRPLLRGASMVRFTADGFALLGRAGRLLGAPLAGLHGQSVEDAREVLTQVAGVRASGIVHFDVARNGTLVYLELGEHGDELELVWLDRDGTESPVGLPKGEYLVVRFSPDGKRVAMAIGPGGGSGGDIWIFDPAGGALSKFTFDGRSASPIWSRDGREVTYHSRQESGAEEIRQRPADGSREVHHRGALRRCEGACAGGLDAGRFAAVLGRRRRRIRRGHPLPSAGRGEALPFAATSGVEDRADRLRTGATWHT
ncbi:MAG: protein kinase [Thermoanaerobaculia bacterium]